LKGCFGGPTQNTPQSGIPRHIEKLARGWAQPFSDFQRSLFITNQAVKSGAIGDSLVPWMTGRSLLSSVLC
jgi:hypothetical protein